MELMKRNRVMASVVGFCLSLVLSACGSGSVPEASGNPGSGSYGSDPVFSAPEDGSDIDMETWLLAAGMECAEESARTLSEYVESLRTYGYEYEGEAVSAMCRGEMVNALLVPHQAGDAWEILYPDSGPDGADAAAVSQICAKYVTPIYFMESIRSNYSSFLMQNSDDREKTEKIQKMQVMYGGTGGFMAVNPTDEFRDMELFIFYGSKDSPEACITVAFHSSGNDIITCSALCWDADMTQYMVDALSGYSSQGTWFTKEELTEAQRDAGGVQREIPRLEESDNNEFLIQTVKSANDSFCRLCDSFGELEVIDDDVQAMRIFADAAGKFDTAAIMTVKEEKDDIYGMAMSFSSYLGTYRALTSDSIVMTSWIGFCENMLKGATDTSYSLPQGWTEDVYILLGSADADFYALVSFQEVPGQALSVDYLFFPLAEEESFMDIQGMAGNWKKIDNDYCGGEYLSDAVFSFASPYGSWDSYDGIQNLYQAEDR